MQNFLIDDLDSVLANTRDLWDELREQSIFLTGGTGFFGCWLLETLLWANDRLGLRVRATVLTRNPRAFEQKAPHLAGHPVVRMIAGDVRSFQFPTGRFSHVIHAATQSSAALNHEQPGLMFDTIVEGTRHCLDFALASGAQKFLLTSSGAVYGAQPPQMTHIAESFTGGPDPLDPNRAYAEGKRAAEMLCVLASRGSGLETKIARCFAFVGPWLPLDTHFAIGNFIRDAMRGGPIEVKGDGTPYRSYLYATDLAVWLWTILLRGQACHPYNVGGDQEITIADLADEVRKAINPSAKIHVAAQPRSASLPPRYVPATTRAKSELGLTATINPSEAIRRTAAWCSNGANPALRETAPR